MDPNERPNLEGPPPGPASSKSTPRTTSSTSSFEFNRPTIIALLYLASAITGLTAIIGVVLAYVWKNEPQEPWEVSHFEYQVRTFWIGVIGTFIGAILLLVMIGVLILLATAVLVIVRTVLSLLNAQKQEPMPNPDSWTI